VGYNVRAFKEEVVPGGRAGAGRRAGLGQGPYGLRMASDTPWHGGYGYSQRDGFGPKLGGAFLAAARVVFPVVVLLASLAGIYLYRDTPVALFLDGERAPWLTAAHLLVPVAFFCVFMTNRRYGPGIALAQVITALAAVAVVILFGRQALNDALPLDSVPPMRDAAAFGAAFFAAGLVSIVVFDGARGANWWSAPLFAFVSVAIVFPPAFFAADFAGTATPWLDHAWKYAAVVAGEGLILLVPFWMLRRVVPPMAGFGGY